MFAFLAYGRSMKKSQSSVYFVLSFWMFIKGYVFGTWLKLLGINTYGMFLFGMFTCALCLTSDDILLRGGWMSIIAIGLLFMGLWDMFRLGE